MDITKLWPVSVPLFGVISEINSYDYDDKAREFPSPYLGLSLKSTAHY